MKKGISPQSSIDANTIATTSIHFSMDLRTLHIKLGGWIVVENKAKGFISFQRKEF